MRGELAEFGLANVLQIRSLGNKPGEFQVEGDLRGKLILVDGIRRS